MTVPAVDATSWPDLIEGLRGTCGDLDGEHEGLWNNAEFCAAVDDAIFRCEVCEWWCELSEMAAEGNSQGICDQCCDDE